MHVLLRPAEGRVNARLRDGLPDAVDSIRGAERTERAREESRSGIEGARDGDAQLYNPTETSVGGIHSMSLILGEPESYNLPPAPEVPTLYLKSAWTSAFVSAAILMV